MNIASRFRAYLELGKPRLSQLVVLTALCGAAVAPGDFSFFAWCCLGFGTAAIVMAANTLNSYLERDVDALMERTKLRPLVTGKVSPPEALMVGLGLLGLAIVLLYQLNPSTLWLGILGLVSYVAFYTPLKRFSSTALLVGAIPGAIPPMMGWIAKTNSFEWGAWILFGILFFWQLPHFLAISLNRAHEYSNAGLKTVPNSVGLEWTKGQMLVSSVLLLIISWLPFSAGLAGTLYLMVAMSLGLSFCILCVTSILRGLDLNWSRLIFFATLVYLPLVLGVWVLDQWLING